MRAPGSPAGARTCWAGMVTRVSIEILSYGGGWLGQIEWGAGVQMEWGASLHGFAYIFHDIFGKGISLKMTFSGHTLL